MTLSSERVGLVRCGTLRCRACWSTSISHSTSSSGLPSISQHFATLSLQVWAQCCLSTGSSRLSAWLLSQVLSRHVLRPESEGEKLLSARTELLAQIKLAFSALGPVLSKENLVLAFEMTVS